MLFYGPLIKNTVVAFDFEKPSLYNPRIPDFKTPGLFGDLACDFCTVWISGLTASLQRPVGVLSGVQDAMTERELP